MTKALDIAGLAVSFPIKGGSFQALDIASLTVAPGEILALVGESGSGKSTLALACLDLVPKPAKVSGEVRLREAGAAMIFQNPGTALSPFFTVGRQMTDILRRRRGLDRKAARRACIESLGSVHLPDPEGQLAKYPHQLSGGQLQRVMIGLALACQPDLLIADEPTTALDVTIQAQIILLLRDLAASRNLAILFITHDLGVAAALCDRVAVIYGGVIVEQAPVAEIFAQPRHPYTASLIAAVPILGRGDVRLEGIPGQPPGPSSGDAGCRFAPRCAIAKARCRSDRPVLSVDADREVACHFPLRAEAAP